MTWCRALPAARRIVQAGLEELIDALTPLSYRNHFFFRTGGLTNQSTPRIQPARSFALPARPCSRSLLSNDTSARTFRDGNPTDNSQTLNETISQSEFVQTAIPLTVEKCGLPWGEGIAGTKAVYKFDTMASRLSSIRSHNS